MSRTKKNENGKKAKAQPITAQEAVSILQSAIGYCQQAGIAVQAYNWPDGVTLTLPGVFYRMTNNGTAAEFHIGTAPANNGTSKAEVPAQAQS